MTALMRHGESLKSYVGRQWRHLRTMVLPPTASDAAPLPVPGTLFATIGGQRSGTHLFREIVNSSPCVALLSEPFSREVKSVQWCNHVRSLPATKFPPLFPNDALELLDDYLKCVRQDVERDPGWYGGKKPTLRALGVDVKYNQLHCVTSLVQDLLAQPILLEFFRSRKFHMIQIVRRNVVHAAISLSLAIQRGTWQNYHHTEFSGRYSVPWSALHEHILWYQREQAEFERIAHDLPLHTCYYEDMVDDLKRVDSTGKFPPDTKVFSSVAKLLDVPNEFQYKSSIRKVINKPYHEVLENYDELVVSIRNSAYAEYADTI